MGSCCIKKMCVWTQSGRYQQPNASAIDPDTWDLCVRSVPVERRCTDSKILSFTHFFRFSFPLIFSFVSHFILMFLHTFLTFLSHLLCFIQSPPPLSLLSFHSAPCGILNLSSFSFPTSFLHWPTASLGLHTHCTITSVFSPPVSCLYVI